MGRLVLILMMMSFSAISWAGNNISMIVGTYTDSGSKGIYSLRFDQETGKAVFLDSLAVKNPSYLTFSPKGNFIYSVSENGGVEAKLYAIKYDKTTGKMQFINKVRTFGEDPCFVETNGKFALTANYSGGNMTVFPIKADGSLGEKSYLFNGKKGGKNPRQATPHVHTARFFGKDNILTTDFSSDKILLYNISNGKVSENGTAGFTLPNSGPRHMDFSKDKRYVYVISELSGTVSVFKNNKNSLERIQTISSDSLGGRGSADIHLSNDGAYLYASNRLVADGISIYKVDKATGLLKKIGYQNTGIHPRNFSITPNGKYLLCACRDSNVIQVYRVDKNTGFLTNTHNDIILKKPVCVKFQL